MVCTTSVQAMARIVSPSGTIVSNHEMHEILSIVLVPFLVSVLTYQQFLYTCGGGEKGRGSQKKNLLGSRNMFDSLQHVRLMFIKKQEQPVHPLLFHLFLLLWTFLQFLHIFVVVIACFVAVDISRVMLMDIVKSVLLFSTKD